jgi:hypothetical protein
MSTVDLIVNNPPCPTCTMSRPQNPPRLIEASVPGESFVAQWCPTCCFVMFARGGLQGFMEYMLGHKGVHTRIPRPSNGTQDVRMAFPIGVNPQRRHNAWLCPTDNTPTMRWDRRGLHVNLCERGCAIFEGGNLPQPAFTRYVEGIILTPYEVDFVPAIYWPGSHNNPAYLWG